MPVRKGASATTRTISQVNQTLISEALRANGPLSRAQIGAITGLSPATVNRLTATLIASGVVVDAGVEPSRGGRPAVRLRYAGDTHAVIAIYVRFDGLSGAVVDLDGRIRHHESVEFPQHEGLDAVDGAKSLDLVHTLTDRMLKAATDEHLTCVGIGVAVPGVVHQPGAVVRRIPELGWADLPLGDDVHARTGLPVTVENDANALAFGELHAGAGRDASSLIALLLDNGFGAGIITNRQLHRGARAEAGEVAYMLTDRDALSRPVSQQGDLEDRIGASALTREARARGLVIPDGSLLTAQQVFALSRDGDPIAVDLAEEILDMVSISVAAMTTILDPEVVIIGGALTADAGLILSGIAERLAGRLMSMPQLTASALGTDGVLRGVAEMAAESVRGDAYLVS